MKKAVCLLCVATFALTWAAAAGAASISEDVVQHWLRGLEIPGFKRTGVYNEFHPDDGNLAATFTAKNKLLFVSVVDLSRKSEYGFKRNAREMVAHGAKTFLKEYTIQDRKWYGDATTYPIIAADLSPNIKLVLMGYQGVSLDELPGLAEGLPMESLVQAAH